jgi:hypothetical protein
LSWNKKQLFKNQAKTWHSCQAYFSSEKQKRAKVRPDSCARGGGGQKVFPPKNKNSGPGLVGGLQVGISLFREMFRETFRETDAKQAKNFAK